jgi:hypothetical protein
MAVIKLNDLQPAGVDFFEDNEGYLSELSEDELTVWGGQSGVNTDSAFVPSLRLQANVRGPVPVQVGLN